MSLVKTKRQSQIVKDAINSYLDKGLTDRQDIYSLVVEKYGVPRPTVRRIARELRLEMIEKVKILEKGLYERTFS